MLHACVERFDVMGGRGNILGWHGKWTHPQIPEASKFVLYACQIPAKLYRILLNKWMRRILSPWSKLGCSLRAEHHVVRVRHDAIFFVCDRAAKLSQTMASLARLDALLELIQEWPLVRFPWWASVQPMIIFLPSKCFILLLSFAAGLCLAFV
jgi:hypothetical protein